MKRLKFAIALGVVAFLLTAAGSSASAFWSSQAGVASTAKVASLASSCSNVTSVQNASFELPVINQSWTWAANGTVPGWVSTDPVGIEIWQSGFNGVVAPVGNQFVELNANEAGTLSQSISTTPGQILQWSLLHRGRVGVDTMQVLIGGSYATLQPIRTISDGTSAWGRYSGAYVVPAGQTTTELAFRAISTATGDLTVGNLMDDVSFGSGPCLTSAATVTNLTNPGSTAYHPGDVVQYSTTVSNIGSTLSYKSVLTAPLPASVAYKAGSLTIDGAAQTDASGDDQAEYVAGTGGTGTVTARLGAAASATAGGTIAQGTSTTVSFQATVVGAVGTTIHFTPSANYVNGLAPLWAAPTATATDIPITVTLGVDVGITAAAPTPATLTAGVVTPTTWNFVVKNNGATTANNVVVGLTAPTGYTSTSAPQMTGAVPCAVASATAATCTIGNLAAGASVTITMSGYAAAGTTPGAFAVSAVMTSTSGDPVSTNNSATGTATVVADTTPPSTVTGLAASGTTGSQTTLTWTAATDNASVIGYNVYRGGVLIASVTGTTYTDTLLNPSTSYNYTVKAQDSANNLSAAFSNTATITTSATFTATTFYRVGLSGTTFCIGTGATPPAVASTLILVTCDPTTAYQKWAFLQTLNAVTIGTAGQYFVAPDVAATPLTWDAQSTANLAKADVIKAANTLQEWKPVAETGGTFHFVNVASGRCLAIPGTAVAGLQLVQATCSLTTPSTTQSYTLTGVTP
jgi:uncharacterized repeat protein (TIGR01451 family)